jgi:tetratricopeptide (TPR) repeat protein
LSVQRFFATVAADLLVIVCCLSNNVSSAAVPAKKAPARATTVHRAVAHKPGAKPVAKTTAKPTSKAVIAVQNPNAFIGIYNQSRQAYEAKRYADAEKLAKQSLAMAEKVNGPQHKNVAIISHFTGVILDAENREPEAARYLKRALTIYSMPGNSLGYEDSMLYEDITLGKIAMYQEQYDEAKRYYEAALPMSEKKYGADHEETTSIQATLNDLHQMDNLSDYPQAIGAKVVHWANPAEQPIVVYIGDGADVPGWKPEDKAIVRDAYMEWQQALNNRVRFEFTENPEQADTIVSWMERPKPEELSTTDGNKKKELALGVCSTQFRDDQWVRDNIVLSLNDLKGNPLTPNGIHNVVLHEVAHSMGLVGGHSNNPSDVLFPSNKYDGNRRKKPTQRDINTVVRLYSMPPQITNPPNIHLIQFAKFSEVFQNAGNAFSVKDYATALNGFQTALSIYPIDPEAGFFAGVSAYQLQRYDVAMNYLMPLCRKSETVMICC